MSELQSSQTRLIIEATSADVPALRGFEPFAVGRTTGASGRLVFVRGEFTPGFEAVVSTADCLVLPKDVDASRAAMALPLATVLALWESLGLELGEAAVWTTGSPLSRLAGQVAVWRGACPAVQVGSAGDAVAVDGTDLVEWTDAEIAVNTLTQLTAGRPGLAAIDLSGRADVIDMFLEAMPTFGRLVLGGSTGEPVTIDYYKNIHRKGVVVRTVVIEPAQAFDADAGAPIRAELPRALEILRNAATAERCRELLLDAAAERTEIAAVAR